MADFGASEILAAEVASDVGLSTLGPSVLSAEAAFGAPAAAGLIGSGASGIAGLSGATSAMAGLGETPYLTAYSDAINAGMTVPEASQTAIQAANAANPTMYDPATAQVANQNISNLTGNQFASLGSGSDVGGYGQDKYVTDLIKNYQPTGGTDTSSLSGSTNISGSPTYQLNPTTADTSSALNGPVEVPQPGKELTGPQSWADMPGQSEGYSNTPSSPFGIDILKKLMPDSTAGKIALGMGAVTAADKLFGPKYGTPAPQKYTGALSKFNYNPLTYTPAANPTAVRAPKLYADGGIAALGANSSYPMAQQQNSRYAVASQMPVGANNIRMANLPPTSMAAGGSADLGSYSDGGRMLKGPGDGMSDDIPASISGKQPARLADGEFVVPADVVSHLGNGSTDAGAKQLYRMMDKVRTARTGRKAQGKQINPKKYMPA